MPLRTLSELDDGPSGFGGNSDSDDDTRSLSEHSQLSLSQQRVLVPSRSSPPSSQCFVAVMLLVWLIVDADFAAL